MSIDTLFYMGLLYGSYRLGFFNAQHPGKLAEWGKLLWDKFANQMPGVG